MTRHTVRKSLERVFQDEKPLGESDPDFIDTFNRFAYSKVAKHGSLNDQQRSLVVLSSLIGCQAVEEFAVMAEVALKVGVHPATLKEILYQSVAVLGMGPIFPLLRVTNELLESKNVKLPLPQQSLPDDETVTDNIQRMRVVLQAADSPSGPEPYKADSALGQLQLWEEEYTYGNCYARPILNVGMRELSTWCLLAALGDVDEELERSINTNAAAGNDKTLLADAVLQCAPYIGFPRVRHALRLLEER
ncbi:MAG: carboxymuconolactone decarboxylase family protein [Bifidobacterium sp.]|jgi:4-carboxymuconolactone decarboxylase|nr:carboxymuconolactone decarboxylase family protein [Bifidobacterium sp.]MCH4174619.1 carboxymuconolactone decarboxylase family protein [Bifidobacterium sp.]